MFGECSGGIIQCGAPQTTYSFSFPSQLDYWFQSGNMNANFTVSAGKLLQTVNTGTSYYLVPDGNAVGDFTIEAEMTSYDDDTFTLVWNRLTNGNRDYVQFNGGNSNTIGNETVT